MHVNQIWNEIYIAFFYALFLLDSAELHTMRQSSSNIWQLNKLLGVFRYAVFLWWLTSLKIYVDEFFLGTCFVFREYKDKKTLNCLVFVRGFIIYSWGYHFRVKIWIKFFELFWGAVFSKDLPFFLDVNRASDVNRILMSIGLLNGVFILVNINHQGVKTSSEWGVC